MKPYKYCLNILISLLIISTGLISGCVTQQTPGTGSDTLIFEDDFKDPKSGWFVYKADTSKGGAYEQGAYNVWSTGRNTVIVLNPKTRRQLADFSAEVDLRTTSTLKGAIMGIIYRLDDIGNYYRFGITDSRTFYVGRGKHDREEEIEPMTPSDIIKPGNEYNRLKVVCSGDTQDFYINGSKLATITDNTSMKGELGISFSNWAPSENYTFTNFKLYNLK